MKNGEILYTRSRTNKSRSKSRVGISLLIQITAIILSCLAVGFLGWFSLNPYNPDWFAYQIIYESEGAWIALLGRDPLFIELIKFFNIIFGSYGYENFRYALVIYFLLFTAWLASGRLLRYLPFGFFPLSFSIATVSFAFTRFTIQIREGLATTFLLIGLSLFERSNNTPKGVWTYWMTFWSLTFFACAALTHFATAVVVISVMFALLIGTSDPKRPRRIRLAWVFSILSGAIFIGLVSIGPLQSIILENVGDRFIEAQNLTLERAFLWSIYGGITFWIWREIKRLLDFKVYRGRTAMMLGILTGPISFVSIACVFVLLFTNAPTLVISFFARVLYLLVGVNLLYLSAKSKKYLAIIMVCAFLMIDQARVINVAVSEIFGIKIF